MTKAAWAAVILVIIAATAVRLWRFDTLPLGLHHDGALEGLEAIELSQHPLPYRPYSTIGWQGETMFRYGLAGLIRILGPYPWVLRLGSTIFSILTVPAVFLLARQLYGRRVAIYTAVLIACSGWPIIMGKTVWRVVTLPFFASLFFWAFSKFCRRPSPGWGIVSGILAAFTVNAYNSGRVLPLVILAWAIIYRSSLFPAGAVLRHWKSLLAASLTALILLSPLIAFAVRRPDVFNSRADFLFVGNRIIEKKSLAPLWDNVAATALMFTKRAGGDDFFVNEPLTQLPVSLLFVAGVLAVIVTIRERENRAAAAAFTVFLLPGLLTVPNGNRAMGSLPFVYIFAGIGASAAAGLVGRVLPRGRRVVSAGVGAVLLLWSAAVYYRTYVGPTRRDVFGFYPETTVVGQYMAPRVATTDFYLTDNYPRDTLTFITYQGGNPYEQHYTWMERDDGFLAVMPAVNRTTVFVMMPYGMHEGILAALQDKYPSGKRMVLPYREDGTEKVAAWLFIVPPGQSVAFRR